MTDRTHKRTLGTALEPARKKPDSQAGQVAQVKGVTRAGNIVIWPASLLWLLFHTFAIRTRVFPARQADTDTDGAHRDPCDIRRLDLGTNSPRGGWRQDGAFSTSILPRFNMTNLNHSDRIIWRFQPREDFAGEAGHSSLVRSESRFRLRRQ